MLCFPTECGAVLSIKSTSIIERVKRGEKKEEGRVGCAEGWIPLRGGRSTGLVSARKRKNATLGDGRESNAWKHSSTAATASGNNYSRCTINDCSC